MIEDMKQWLEALESYHGYMEPLTTVFGGPRVPAEQSTTGKVEKAITSLRQAIAELESQEPVAWMDDEAIRVVTSKQKTGMHETLQKSYPKPLYNHPPQRTEQEPVECDGDFPEGFDKSLDIPAQALRQANAALCEVTNIRMWDVPALAERMLMFCRNTPTHHSAHG
jgi:hypothetical protein